MTTPWRKHEDIQLNLPKSTTTKNYTYTIFTYKYLNQFHIGCQASIGDDDEHYWLVFGFKSSVDELSFTLYKPNIKCETGLQRNERRKKRKEKKRKEGLCDCVARNKSLVLS